MKPGEEKKKERNKDRATSHSLNSYNLTMLGNLKDFLKARFIHSK